MKEIEYRPMGSNPDEWHLFLSERLDNRAAFPGGLEFAALIIAEAIDAARADERRRCGEIVREIKDAAELDLDDESLDPADREESGCWVDCAGVILCEIRELR